jgi:hypothetical protein
VKWPEDVEFVPEQGALAMWGRFGSARELKTRCSRRMSICRIDALDRVVPEPSNVRGGSSRVGKDPGGLHFEGLDSR